MDTLSNVGNKKIQINKENLHNEIISSISIVHRTCQTRIISEKEHVYDVNFLQLIEAMNNDKKHEIFSKNMTVKYCGYSKNQLQNYQYIII